MDTSKKWVLLCFHSLADEYVTCVRWFKAHAIRRKPQKLLREVRSMPWMPIPLETKIRCFRPLHRIPRQYDPELLRRLTIRAIRPTRMKSFARSREIPPPVRLRRHWRHTHKEFGTALDPYISAMDVSEQPCFSLDRCRYGAHGFRRSHWEAY